MTKRPFELLEGFHQALHKLPLIPMFTKAQNQWDIILQKSLAFYENKALLNEYIQNDLNANESNYLNKHLSNLPKIDHELSYDWDCLLFPHDDWNHCLLQALIDYEQLTLEEENFIQYLFKSQLSIYQVKNVYFDQGMLILEDIFTHQSYRVFDEILLLDAFLGLENTYLFTRLIPVSDAWILAAFEHVIDAQAISSLSCTDISFSHQMADQLWHDLNQ